MANKFKNRFKFSNDDKEWILTNIVFITQILDMQVKPILIFERSQFKKYLSRGKGNLNGNGLHGQCIKETGLFWISPHLATMPKAEILNTLFHECLHIKYPEWNESKVTKEAYRLMPVEPDEDTKKKRFDNF